MAWQARNCSVKASVTSVSLVGKRRYRVAGADPGAAGYFPHRHVEAFGGEHLAGCLEDEVAVVPGVGAQGVRQTIGHRSHFS